jgi:hypothetical protein
MPETVDQPGTGSETGNTGNQQTQAPGWLAGLPADLRENESFKSYKTVGDFAKAHIETASKLKDVEGKLGNSIPKLGENATQEERDRFFNSLGRPEKPDGYELEGGDKEKEQFLSPWKQDFHELGLTAAQAKGLKAKFDGRINALVAQHQAKAQQDIADASTKLKAELGDKYDANVELASRLWKRDADGDLEKDFEAATGPIKFSVIRYILKTAAKTGEDTSSRGTGQRQQSVTPAFIAYDKSPAPPRRM